VKTKRKGEREREGGDKKGGRVKEALLPKRHMVVESIGDLTAVSGPIHIYIFHWGLTANPRKTKSHAPVKPQPTSSGCSREAVKSVVRWIRKGCAYLKPIKLRRVSMPETKAYFVAHNVDQKREFFLGWLTRLWLACT